MRKLFFTSFSASALLLGAENVTLGSVDVTETPISVSSDGIDVSRSTSLPKSASVLEEVITRETIVSLNPSDIFDVLQYASSIFIQRQGRKAPSWVKVRGNRSLGIIIDGVYIPAAVTSRILAMLPVEAIERIRIVRDSATLNLGPLPNGTGGLIGGDDAGYLVIETRLPSKTTEGGVVLQGESFGRKHLSAMAGTLGEYGYLNVVADYDDSDGDPDWTTGFAKHSLYAKGGLFLGDWSFDLQTFLTDSTKELQRSTSPGVSDAKWAYDPMRIAEVSAKLGYSSDFGVTSLAYAHSDLRAELQKEKWSDPSFHATEVQQEDFDHLRLDHAAAFENYTLRAGVEGIWWHTPTGEYFYTGWEKKERTAGAFVQGEWAFDALSFDAGARVDKTWIDIGYEQIGPKKVRIEDESYEPVMALALGMRWAFTPSEAFYLRSRFSTQNAPEVETESGSSLSASTRLGFEGGMESNRYTFFRPRLSLYYLDVSDAPYVVSQHADPDDPTELVNAYGSKDWREYGAELALAGAYEPLSYQLSYSYNRNDDDALDERVPHSTFNGIVKYAENGFEGTVGVYYIDAFEAVNKAGTGEAGDYTNLDLSLGYAFEASGLQNKVLLYTRNLTDDDYESVYGFPSMGRIVGATYRLAF
jgi:outer membrane cobalamin receptor